MSTLNHIEKRHGFDKWKNVLFVGVAVLLAGLAIGSVTTAAQGRAPKWGVVMMEQPTILDPTLQGQVQAADATATPALPTETAE